MDNLHHHEALFQGEENKFNSQNIEINIKDESEEGNTFSNSFGRDYERVCSSTSINSLFDSNEYYCDGHFKNDTTHTTASSLISTPFLLTNKTSLEVQELSSLLSQRLNFEKTVIILVGLPASGKSTLSKQLCGFLDQRNYKSKIYNAGDIRRKFKHNSFNSSDFFDPHNLKAKYEREIFATTSLSTLLHDLNKKWINVGFLDATNTTIERRRKIMQYIRESPVQINNTIVMDVQCSDKNLMNFNISGKAFNADYKGKDYDKSVLDFKERARHYNKIYDPVTMNELTSYSDIATHYIQVINGGRKVNFTIISEPTTTEFPSDNEFFTLLQNFMQNYPEREGKRYFEAVDAFYKNKTMV